MNLETLFKVQEEINGTIAVFPDNRTVTVTPSFKASCIHGVARYDYGCFDAETIEKLETERGSIVYYTKECVNCGEVNCVKLECAGAR